MFIHLRTFNAKAKWHKDDFDTAKEALIKKYEDIGKQAPLK